MQFTTEERNLIAINAYLPYYSADIIVDYLFYIGKLSSILETIETCDFFVLGDFNANSEEMFLENWLKVCEDYGTILSDAAFLPDSSFTHVNHGSLTRAWLDHCLSSQTFHNSISKVCRKIRMPGFRSSAISDYYELCGTSNFYCK